MFQPNQPVNQKKFNVSTKPTNQPEILNVCKFESHISEFDKNKLEKLGKYTVARK